MNPSVSVSRPRTSRLGWWLALPPACAVVAGFFTLWLAISIPDPVVMKSRPASGQVVHDARSQWPAQAARNHAATSPNSLQLTQSQSQTKESKP
jgi:uncharacterized protein